MKKIRENDIYDKENDEIFFNENSNDRLIIGKDKVVSNEIFAKNKIESDSNAQSNNIISELNKLESWAFNKNKSDKQRFNQSQIMTLNNKKDEENEESITKELKEKNENPKRVEFQIEKRKNRGKERKEKVKGMEILILKFILKTITIM